MKCKVSYHEITEEEISVDAPTRYAAKIAAATILKTHYPDIPLDFIKNSPCYITVAKEQRVQTSPKKEVPEHFRAWLAGFFDGEGSVTVGTKQHTVILSIANTKKEVIQLIHNAYGGNLTPVDRGNPNWSPYWILTWSNPIETLSLVKDIEPYTHVKGEQLKLAKTYFEQLSQFLPLRKRIGTKGPARMSPDEITFRQTICNSIKQLNSSTRNRREAIDSK